MKEQVFEKSSSMQQQQHQQQRNASVKSIKKQASKHAATSNHNVAVLRGVKH